jgi:hypothetical protein
MAVDARNFSFYFHPVLLLLFLCFLSCILSNYAPRGMQFDTLHYFSFFLEKSVVDPDPHGSALVFLSVGDPDPVGKTTKKETGINFMLTKCWILSFEG